MRKDSEVFLKKLVKYHEEENIDRFELSMDFFSEIPNITTEINAIIEELKSENCISQKSDCSGEVVQIYLTLDGIMYFREKLEEKINSPIIFNVEGGQVNVASGDARIEATQLNRGEKVKVIVIKERSIVHTGRSTVNSSSSSDNGFLIMALFCALILTKCYLDYKFEVQMGLVTVSILTEIITLFTYYKGRKTGIIYGKSIRAISCFNMFTIGIVPMLIVLINSPMYISKVRLDLFVEAMNKRGIIVAFFQSEYSYYALCQMIGMVTLAAFLIYIVVSDIYIVSIINIVENRKGKWLWETLLRSTYKGNDNWKNHIFRGVVLIVVSILFVGGVLPFIITRLTQMSIST